MMTLEKFAVSLPLEFYKFVDGMHSMPPHNVDINICKSSNVI